MFEPPPAPPKLERVPCGDDLICYRRDDAALLGLWASAIKRWADDAWACNQPSE